MDNTIEIVAAGIFSKTAVQTISIDGLDPNDVRKAHAYLKRFVEEVPWKERRKWAIRVKRDPKFWEVDDVVFQKKKTDRKTCLHYRPDSEQILNDAGIFLNDWQKDWFATCDRIWKAYYNTYHRLAEAFDTLHPEYRFVERVEAIFNEHCLRFLFYKKGDGNTKPLARPHPDRCLVAFHGDESHSGLEMRNGFEWNRQDSPVVPNAHVFPGRQFASLTAGAIMDVWHRVIDTTNGTDERFAMVFFGKIQLDENMYV